MKYCKITGNALKPIISRHMPEHSISIHVVRGLLSKAKQQGYDIDQFLRCCNIAPPLINEDHARISAEQFTKLTRHVVKAMRDEQTGHLPQPLQPGTFAMMGLAVIHCQTLREAFDRSIAFFNLFKPGLTPELSVTDELAAFKLTPSDNQFIFDSYAYETNLVFFYRFANWLISQYIPLEKVDLNYSPPPHVDEYRFMFFNCPLEFNQDANRLIFKSNYLDAPVRQNEKTLRQLHKNYSSDLLTQHYGYNSSSSRIRAIIGNNPMELPEFIDIAKQLAMHPQTLRRRLKEEHTSYRDIKNQVRRDIAIYHLGKKTLSVDEVAFRSGFSEASAFIRAFKNWTGVTPLAYRKGL